MSKVKQLLITLKEAGLIVAALSVIFLSGRTYQTVQDLKEQIKKAVPEERYQEDKDSLEKNQGEVKESISNLDKKLDNRFEYITVRLDGLYNLILSNGKEIAENK